MVARRDPMILLDPIEETSHGLSSVAGTSREMTDKSQRIQISSLEGIKPITFDVQGTCVDFYQPILRVGASVNQKKGLKIDWAAMSAGWRDLYRVTTDAVIAGERPWLRVDQIYHEALDILLEQYDLGAVFSNEERDQLNGFGPHLILGPTALKEMRCCADALSLRHCPMPEWHPLLRSLSTPAFHLMRS